MANLRYSLALPTDQVGLPGEFLTCEALMEIASAMEEAGAAACYVTDHPFPPAGWLASGGHHALDPMVALSFAAAATSRLLLHTNCLVPAYRNPFISAKAVASLDALSGGRVVLGVAAGYLPDEFAALGAPFEARGRLLEESVGAMELAWSGKPVEARGRGWEARGSVMLPLPVTRPHPPVWVGGNSPAAMARAARVGQGWSPFPVSPRTASDLRTTPLRDVADLAARIEELRSLRRELGREEPFDVCVTPFSHPWGRRDVDPAELREEAETLASVGVTWLAVYLPAPDRATLLEEVHRFGAEVVGA